MFSIVGTATCVLRMPSFFGSPGVLSGNTCYNVCILYRIFTLSLTVAFGSLLVVVYQVNVTLGLDSGMYECLMCAHKVVAVKRVSRYSKRRFC